MPYIAVRSRIHMVVVALTIGVCLGFLETRATAQANLSAAADAKVFDAKIRPLLEKHCIGCHGAEKPKGDLRLDQLSADFNNATTRERWLTVLTRVKAGEMPPKTKPRPTNEETKALTAWIGAQLTAADAARRAEGRVVLRRLNRVEYQNTLRDLLGVQVDLGELLPKDESSHGFDNVGEALHISSFLMERYLEAAELALKVSIANGPQPPVIKKRYSLKDSHTIKSSTERVYRKLDDDTVVLFSSSAWNAVHLYQFYPPDRGAYRFRLAVSGVQSAGKPVTFKVLAGGEGLATQNQKRHLVGYFDARSDKQDVIEFVDHLEARNTIVIHPYGSQYMPYGLATAQTVNKIGADKYEGPGLAVHWVEVEGPLHESWPPPSHRRIFGDLPQAPAPIYNQPKRVEVVSKNPEADAERVVRDFARRAFRRAVSDDDVKPFVKLVKDKLAAKYSFERAVRVGLMAVMVSPEFLFLRERAPHPTLSPKGGEGNLRLDDFALASRLSYFLWSTMPDEELLTLAEQKKLSQPETLRRQVERMLKDRKAEAFTENFVGQWLNLRDIDFTEPSILLYPEFDDMLKVSMVREAELFFAEVLKDDLSLMNFIASDFTMLNGRLAKHYGIPLSPLAPGGRGDGGEGLWEFKKVKLPADSHRGGVLTMAGVLKVTANGTTTSPVTRGAWVLERILGTPPPPPPADVPAVEPDIRGAVTIREQLAKHRQIATCANCHAKIDPPGFALESFDVIGGWRENYRMLGNGKPVAVEGRRMPYNQGRKVDPADEFQGHKFADIDEFKRLLLRDKDQIARALTERLVTYATGAAPALSDRAEIDAIVGKIRAKDYGFRTLVHEVVLSRLFQSK